MSRVAFTLRIDARERAALDHLSEVEGRPVNQLLNEAIKLYLSRLGPIEHKLEANLAGLREYRKQDPGFQQAIDSVIGAEAATKDPVEGEAIIGEFVEGEFEPAGPVQAKIRELLGA